MDQIVADNRGTALAARLTQAENDPAVAGTLSTQCATVRSLAAGALAERSRNVELACWLTDSLTLPDDAPVTGTTREPMDATTLEAGTLFLQGRPSEAITAAEANVRAAPTNVASRLLLAEQLRFSGQFERAARILIVTDAMEPGVAVVVAEFRHMLRSAGARRQVFDKGRVREFLDASIRAQTAMLSALVALRGGDWAEAGAAAVDAENCRPPAPGQADGTLFAGFRDADDLLSGTLEVLTTTGKNYWIPVEGMVTLCLHELKRSRGLVWRCCTRSVRNEPDGEVYMLVLYPEAAEGGDDPLRLGRGTEWPTTAPSRGRGQRLFLVGDNGVPIDHLRQFAFS